jgi:hypothetical protein
MSFQGLYQGTASAVPNAGNNSLGFSPDFLSAVAEAPVF